jgi:hypothetical protein
MVMLLAAGTAIELQLVYKKSLLTDRVRVKV